MTITYNFEIDDDLLIVRTSGSDQNLDEVKAYGMAVIEAARTHECSQILCDERGLKHRLGPLDTYQYARYIATEAPDLGRVAIVPQPDGVRDASFWENVMINRGIMVRVFQSVDEARMWLSA